MLNLNGIYVVAPRDVGADWLEQEQAAEAYRAKRNRDLTMIAFAVVAQVVPFIVAAALLSGCIFYGVDPAPGKATQYEAFMEHCAAYTPVYDCTERAVELRLAVRVRR